VGNISDAITGAPLDACAGFSPVSQPDAHTAYPLTAKYRFLIPADAEVAVKVWLDGYKPWYYPGTDQPFRSTMGVPKNTSMRLKPGEEKTLDIRLQPDPSVHAEMCGIRILR